RSCRARARAGPGSGAGVRLCLRAGASARRSAGLVMVRLTPRDGRRGIGHPRKAVRRTNAVSPGGRMTDATVDPKRWKALAVLSIAYLMVVLDVSIVNVALPSIQHDLGFSTEGLQWVVSG